MAKLRCGGEIRTANNEAFIFRSLTNPAIDRDAARSGRSPVNSCRPLAADSIAQFVVARLDCSVAFTCGVD